MCQFPSGYKFPDGKVVFHTDEDVIAAWDKAGKKEPINWQDMVGHAGWRFCFGNPQAGSSEIEASDAILFFCEQQLFERTKKLLQAADGGLDLGGLMARLRIFA